MEAIIACEVLYEEILTLSADKEINIEFLPQGIHDLPNQEEMRAVIQAKIDELEAQKNYDYLLLGYGFCSGGVEGLSTKRATLVIPFVHDCIPLLLGDQEAQGNIENSNTFYLSRGWIDCGGDVFKEHLFLTDNTEVWLNKFLEHQQQENSTRVSWHQKERYQHQKTYPEETAKYISFECLKGYQSITLIDNDNLAPIHHQYAEAKYNFTDQLLNEERGSGVDYKVIAGKTELLEKLICFTELSTAEQEKHFLISSPGEKLEFEKHIWE
ncbi:DUF1638 domain-containing protein [Fuchsiella alkaliacetigena]|uniref:DUF1638 domain-containing protein n=1 Tax=Fuchsiella alkaliacetigena TaxID=957042 RepID=UPI00200AD04F|nr:DUF1638 domain-containing protein [Fuchsiella alkaliacetigena]MCK8823972.1 DUF1638 domain-containing protein [Fuchsiella alkaliacetigena]